MKNINFYLSVICLSLSFVMNSYANIYRCIESDGRLIFQDHPCTDQENRNETFHQYKKDDSLENKETENVKISRFKAYYYTENDGKNPGKGNDGTIRDIAAKLQFTESVKRPSINFSYSDFNGIDSYNFYGAWEGTIHAFGEGQSAKAHFDVSWGDVSFYVNDSLVEKWRNDSKIIQFNLNKGDNKIRVELHNHWHTTSFNVSFTAYQKLGRSEALEVFRNIDFNSTKAVYLGAYESRANTPGNNYNEILVSLPRSSTPIFIFLNSFRAVNWVISNPHNAKIAGVALRGRSPGSTVAMPSIAPIYELATSENAYKSSYDIQAFIGRNADYAFTEYAVNNIIVTDFFQAKANDVPLKNDSMSSSEHSESGPADNYPVNSFVESLLVRQQGNSVTTTRVVKEPALDGTFIKGSWKGYFDVSQQTDKTFKIIRQGIKVELIIDGRSVWRGRSDSREKIYQYTFKPGRHEVMFVAYPEAEYRPVKFNVSITDNAKELKYDELATRLKGLGDFDSIYCGVKKDISPTQPVDIILKKSEKPVVLFLTSYKQVTWDFKDSNMDNLAAIVTSSKNDSSIKNLPPHIPVYHFFRLSNAAHFIPVSGRGISRNIDNTFKQAALQILALAGELPAGFSGLEHGNRIVVPEIVLDREKYRQIGFADVSPDYNIFIEYPEKIDAVFNPVTTKYVDPNSSSRFVRGKQIKPEVIRESWAKPLGATEDIPTGAFKAYYFDIFNPGQPKFSGIVEDVAVNSSGVAKKNSTGSAIVSQHGIIPENFGAFWIGNIALETDKVMEINIDQSNSVSRVLIDDNVVTGRTISLKKGLHKVEIEHVNNWHTYDFCFSLSEPQPLLAYEELKEQLEDILPRRVHTAYVGVSDSKNYDNSINLEIQKLDKPIFLILASSKAINWVIKGPGAKDVKALLVWSAKSQSKIKGNIKQDTPIFHFPMWNTYQLESKCECQGKYYCSSKDLFDTIDYIETVTGQTLNSFTGDYNEKSFIVPEIIIDKEQFKALSRVAEENLQAQSRCEGPEFSPQYLSDKQKKQIDDQVSVQAAIKIMESIRDNEFDEYAQLWDPKRLKFTSVDGIKKMLLFQHNAFAGYDPSVAYHMIDEKMYESIVNNKAKLIIPLVLKKKNLKDHYLKVHMNKAGGRWVVSSMD